MLQNWLSSIKSHAHCVTLNTIANVNWRYNVIIEIMLYFTWTDVSQYDTIPVPNNVENKFCFSMLLQHSKKNHAF